MTNQIKCPYCGEEIEISAALAHSLREEIEQQVSHQYRTNEQKKIKASVETAVAALQAELEFKSKKLDEARADQLKLHKEKLQLEDEKKSFEVEKQKMLEQERNKIRQQTLVEFSEEHRLRDAEKDKVIHDLKKSLEDAQRKASQTSQQLQGEVLELDLENYLRSTFPADEVTPVGKGIRGADISQVVRTSLGTVCGVILWEIKRTKAWVDDWTDKLKEDLRNSKSDVPVIVSTVLPKDIQTGFGLYKGVWVSDPKYIHPLAEILRKSLIDVARERHHNQDRGTKADLLYSYITSNEFVLQIQNILEVYKQQQDQIQKERAAFEKIWKEREMLSQRIIKSVASVYGTIQGAAGQSLPSVKGLELLEE